MIKKTLLLSALIAAISATLPAHAQSILDQQLGPTPAQPPAKPVPSTGEKPATPPATPTAQPPAQADIINPDAVKKVDDNELIKDLIEPGSNKLDPAKVQEQTAAMLQRMSTSGQRLTEKDPGEITQETQRRIVMDLDTMIEIARRQQQQQSSSSQQQQQQQGEQRQPGQPSGQQQTGGNTAATNDPLSRGGVSDAAGNDVNSRNANSWGGLPPRDRDQISNGAKEEQVSTYRQMIDKYYQALSELGSTKR